MRSTNCANLTAVSKQVARAARVARAAAAGTRPALRSLSALRALSALFAVGLLWASAPAHAGAAGATEATKPGTATASEGKATVMQRSKGNQSGVIVRPTVPEKLAVGETATLRLHLSGVNAAEGATVEVRDLAARVTVASVRLAQGEQRTLEIPYTGRADGMQFMDVITTQAGRSTVHTVPIRVGTGEVRLKPHGQRHTTADGQAVISLPAATPGSGR